MFIQFDKLINLFNQYESIYDEDYRFISITGVIKIYIKNYNDTGRIRFFVFENISYNNNLDKTVLEEMYTHTDIELLCFITLLVLHAD